MTDEKMHKALVDVARGGTLRQEIIVCICIIKYFVKNTVYPITFLKSR